VEEAVTVHSLKDLFRFPFREPEGRSRFVIGSVLVLVSYVLPTLPLLPVYGYLLRILRERIRGEPLALPAWEDWGQLTLDGLKAMLVSLVYLLPGGVVFFGGLGLYTAAVSALVYLENTAEGPTVALGVALSLLFPLAIIVLFLSLAVGMLLMVAGAIPLPLALAHLAQEERLAAAFHVREWWGLLRANAMGYFVGWVIAAGLLAMWYVAFLLLYYTGCLCALIPFVGAPTGFYLSLVGAVVFGQVYRESTALLSEGQRR